MKWVQYSEAEPLEGKVVRTLYLSMAKISQSLCKRQQIIDAFDDVKGYVHRY